MDKIDFSKIENPTTKHILKSFHTREDFGLQTYNGVLAIYETKQYSVPLFNPMWDKTRAEVIVAVDVRGSEAPETKVPMRIIFRHDEWQEWVTVYLGWIENIEAFDVIMRGIGLFGDDED